MITIQLQKRRRVNVLRSTMWESIYVEDSSRVWPTLNETNTALRTPSTASRFSWPRVPNQQIPRVSFSLSLLVGARPVAFRTYMLGIALKLFRNNINHIRSDLFLRGYVLVIIYPVRSWGTGRRGRMGSDVCRKYCTSVKFGYPCCIRRAYAAIALSGSDDGVDFPVSR